MKVVILLRDPTLRAYSAWQMYRRYVREQTEEWFTQWMRRCDPGFQKEQFTPRSRRFGVNFEDDMREEIAVIASGCKIAMPILDHGLYANQVAEYLRVFGSTQVCVLRSEELLVDTCSVLGRLEKFLELSPHRWKAEMLKPVFTGDYQDSISSGAAALLADYYRDSNRSLNELLGTDMGW